jgi:putative Mn2+ efflux pump MntP
VTPGGPTRVIAASLGLSAFAIAIVAGLAADNPAQTILVRAMASLVACHIVGWCVGMVAERTALEAVAAYELERLGTPAGAVPAGGAKVKDVDDFVTV